MAGRMRLGDILVSQGAITDDQLEAALAWRQVSGVRERLGATIIRLGYITELDVARALGEQLGMPVEDLAYTDIDPEAAGLLPAPVAFESQVLPLRVEGGALVVAMVDPTDIILLDELRLRTGYRSLHPVVVTSASLQAACARVHPDGTRTRELVDSLDDQAPTEEDAPEEEPDAPVVKLANQLLLDAFRLRASDLHVEPTRDGARVRVRVDGILKEVTRVPTSVRRPLTSRFKIMGGMDIAEHRRPQDGRSRLRVDGEDVDIRMSVMPSMHGETVVMRLLRRQSGTADLGELGLAPDVERSLTRALEEPQGMVVVTGPTGSGKTSTLYGGLQHIADEIRNVITLEDPIEYELEGVNQTQMNPRIGLTFASGMRTVLRQDPDVVMVGEIRDSETAMLAVEASMTGHLVLSTLHTNDSIATVARLLELGVERPLLGTSLRYVLSQRLVRVVCAACGEAADADPATLERLEAPADALEGVMLRRGPGCPTCLETGYMGRHVVAEGVRITTQLSELVADGASTRELRMAARAEGMRTLREDGLRLALMGVTTLEEVLRVTPEDPDLSGGDLLASLIHDGWSASGASDRDGQAVSSPTG